MKYKLSQFNIVIDKNKINSTIYNCYSGGVAEIENKILEDLKQPLEKEKIQYADELIENGYIVDCDLDEFSKVKDSIENNCNNPNPTIVNYIIAPTLKCNLDCEYCFQSEVRKNNLDGEMSDKTMFKLIDFILISNKNNKNLQMIKITWFGGEPLLCYEKILKISQILKEKLFKTKIKLVSNIITNGVLLTKDKVEKLIKECNTESIQITLDGEVETYCSKKRTNKNVFHTVLNNIVNASQLLKIIIRLNADKTNYDELLTLIKQLFAMPVNLDNIDIHFAQVRDYSHNENQSLKYFNDCEYSQQKLNFLKKLSALGYKNFNKKIHPPVFVEKPFCGLMAKNNFVIDYKGNLLKCEHHLGLEKNVGNIFDGLDCNNTYYDSLSLVKDNRCRTCNIFPCCNYVQCNIMHEFTGKKDCSCYNNQLQTIINSVKDYLKN